MISEKTILFQAGVLYRGQPGHNSPDGWTLEFKGGGWLKSDCARQAASPMFAKYFAPLLDLHEIEAEIPTGRITDNGFKGVMNSRDIIIQVVMHECYLTVAGYVVAANNETCDIKCLGPVELKSRLKGVG